MTATLLMILTDALATRRRRVFLTALGLIPSSFFNAYWEALKGSDGRWNLTGETKVDRSGELGQLVLGDWTQTGVNHFLNVLGSYIYETPSTDTGEG